MQIPTGVIGILTLLTTIFITNRFRLRFPVIAILCIFPIAGASALVKVPRSQTGGLLAAYYIAYPFSGIQPLLYSWANLNAAGSTKRVTTTAIMFVFQCAGNIIGPQVYLQRENPTYHTGLYVDIACWAILATLATTQGLYLGYLNRKQERRRATLGLPEKLQDISLMRADEADAYRASLTASLAAQGVDEGTLFANSFEDMTDFQNPMFMYVL